MAGGLFSFGTHETGNDKHGNNATNTEHLNLTFCTERVDILRPWYDPTLFTYQVRTTSAHDVSVLDPP